MDRDVLLIIEWFDPKVRSFFLEIKFLIIPTMIVIDDDIARIQKTFRYIHSFLSITHSINGIGLVRYKFNKTLLLIDLMIASILINWNNYPDLIATTMPLPLTNFSIIESKTTLYIEYFATESFDQTCFTNILIVIDRGNFEIATGKLFGISSNNRPITCILVLNSNCHIITNNRKPIVDHVVSIDMKMLEWGSWIILDGEFMAVRLNGEYFVWIFVTADFECLVWSGIEVDII